MKSGPVPVRILRAAQFHEFVSQLLDWGRQGEMAYLPKMRTQLVAARTVAEELARLATGAAAAANGHPVEVAGPREEALAEAARRLVARRGEALRIEAVTNPSDPDAGLYAEGALLPGPGAILGGPTFDEWLQSIPAR